MEEHTDNQNNPVISPESSPPQAHITNNLPYASFWDRYLAYQIDFYIFLIINSLIVWVFISADLQIIQRVLTTLVFLPYFALQWYYKDGQSIGKRFLKIKIIRTDNSKLSLGRSYLRAVGYMVSQFILYIGFLWMLWDDNKQTVHDKIAQTYVIRYEEISPSRYCLAVGIALAPFVLIILGIVYFIINLGNFGSALIGLP